MNFLRPLPSEQHAHIRIITLECLDAKLETPSSTDLYNYCRDHPMATVNARLAAFDPYNNLFMKMVLLLATREEKNLGFPKRRPWGDGELFPLFRATLDRYTVNALEAVCRNEDGEQSTPNNLRYFPMDEVLDEAKFRKVLV